MSTAIYALRDETGTTRYIGKTSQPAKYRFSSHLATARAGRKSRKENWVRKMLREGNTPRMDIIEMVDGDGSKEEVKWIATMRSMGWNLVNQTDGGDGTAGRKHSKETVEKLRQKAIREGESPEKKEFMRKLAAANVGKKATPEHRQKISDGLRGRKLSKEHCEKMRVAMLGVKRGPLSEETKEKIRAAALEGFATGKRTPFRLGKKTVNSPEARAKMSAARIGKRPSEATRKKMSETHKARHSENNFRK